MRANVNPLGYIPRLTSGERGAALPAWTEAAWPPHEPIVTTQLARDWLGIYGDSSVDDEIQACVEAAVEKVADNVGYRISNTTMTDFYAPPAPRALLLSEPGIDRATVVVKYYDEDEAVQTFAGSNYFLDGTSRRNVVRFRRSASLPPVSGEVSNPWLVSYTSDLASVRGTPSVARLRYAVRNATTSYWQARSGLNADPALLDRTLYSLLQSCRLDDEADDDA